MSTSAFPAGGAAAPEPSVPPHVPPHVPPQVPPPGGAAAAASVAADDTGMSPDTSVFEIARDLVSDWVGAVRGRMELAALEVRRAGLALAQILMMAVLATLLVWAAWLALMAGVYIGSVAAGLHWALAILLVVLINLGAAGALWWRAHRLVAYLTFPATRRALQGAPDAQQH